MTAFCMAKLSWLMIITIIKLQLIKASSAENTKIEIRNIKHCEVCSFCSFGPIQDLSSHSIPDEFPMHQMEHAIYPPKMNQNPVCSTISHQIGNVPLKHMKCLVMRIRFAMLESLETSLVSVDFHQVIHEEMIWAAKVLLILWYGVVADIRYYGAMMNEILNTRKRIVRPVLHYLAITLPDQFQYLRANLISLMESLQMNHEKDSGKELIWMVTLAEMAAKRHQIIKVSQMAPQQLFSMPDAYFLYLILEVEQFMKAYSMNSIVEYLLKQHCSSKIIVLEAFDACKTVFIGLLVSKIRKRQVQLLDDLCEFRARFQEAVFKVGISQNEYRKLFDEAQKFREKFSPKHKDYCMENLTFITQSDMRYLEIMINVLEKKISCGRKVNEMERMWITTMKFIPAQSRFAGNMSQHFWRYYNNPLAITYETILKNIVYFGINPSTWLSNCRISAGLLMNYSRIPKPHFFNDFSCSQCRLTTLINFYLLNAINTQNKNIMGANILFLKHHGFFKDFRINWTLQTAFYTSYLWDKTNTN